MHEQEHCSDNNSCFCTTKYSTKVAYMILAFWKFWSFISLELAIIMTYCLLNYSKGENFK